MAITLWSIVEIIIFIAVILVLGIYRDRLKGIFVELAGNVVLALLAVMGFVNLVGIPAHWDVPLFIVAFVGISAAHFLFAPNTQKKLSGY